jgi:hypothetical protein
MKAVAALPPGAEAGDGLLSDRIKTYCQKDVVTVANLMLKFRNEELLRDENVVMI